MIRGDRDDFDVGDLFTNVKEITSIAHFARCQAQEAEMRANYAVNLAERATLEAEAVRNIAESLTKTGRSVAKMSMDHIDKINSAEYRSFKRGDILAAVRHTCERKDYRPTAQSPHATSPRKRQQTPRMNIQRGAVSEETVVHTRLIKEKITTDNKPDNNNKQEYAKLENSAFSTSSNNQTTEFIDNSDLLLCMENLHRQTNSQVAETFPEAEEVKTDLVKEFDSTEHLPIVWEDTYQGQGGRKPMAWSDKKNIRKIQRKLRNLELPEEDKKSEVSSDTSEAKIADESENEDGQDVNEDVNIEYRCQMSTA